MATSMTITHLTHDIAPLHLPLDGGGSDAGPEGP